eukprot:CAMPEP_0118856678 /NCGR_PEP_ID=MMETSP1163-20130328/4062_1 /TAXON_ID=124430 /ORGANISM="Phaeomonas parva, Strain CCMP2877" /LENGTH=38 /DNA_ID= /DNA_START= /DNA_END= /DNA_ORIENTATION=
MAEMMRREGPMALGLRELDDGALFDGREHGPWRASRAR